LVASGASTRVPSRVRGRLRGLVAMSVTIGGSAAACLSSQDIDLGEKLDSGIGFAPSSDLDASLASREDGPSIGVTISASGNWVGGATGTICGGSCVNLVASASGAPGPFEYAWGEDLGEGPGPKTVCPPPNSTTSYSVTAYNDVNGMQGASVTVAVVACDAGSSAPVTTPPSDSGTSPSSSPSDAAGSTPAAASLCLDNPSFNAPLPTMIGTARDASFTLPSLDASFTLPSADGSFTAPLGTTPPNWSTCSGEPNVDPSVSLVPAAIGKTYVGLPVGSGAFSGVTASIGTTLCAPVEPGTRYSFCIDVGIGVQGALAAPPPPGAPAPVLQIFGGTTACAQSDLLWTSPPITNQDSWTEDCASFVATQAVSYLSIVPSYPSSAGAGASSYVIVDNITPGS
jgi:hypothetical protein